jgi:hypothetical protein
MANPFPLYLHASGAFRDARSGPKLTRQMHTSEWPRMLHRSLQVVSDFGQSSLRATLIRLLA